MSEQSLNESELNELSKAMNEYTQTLKTRKPILTLKAMYKQHKKSVESRLRTKKQEEHSNIHELIPQGPCTLNKIDMCAVYKKALKLPKICLSIPETLIQSATSTFCFYTHKENLYLVKGQQAVSKFFQVCRQRQNPSRYIFPRFFLKGTDKYSLFFSETEALAFVNSKQEGTLLRYIECRSHHVSKVRIHWRINGTFQAYLITNRLGITPKKSSTPTNDLNHEESLLGKLKQIKQKIMNTELDEYEVDTPIRLNSTVKTKLSFQTIDTDAGVLKKTYDKKQMLLAENIKKEKGIDNAFVLLENVTNHWKVTKIPSVHPKLIRMIELLAHILNNLISKIDVREIVVDFCSDSEKEWYLLGVKQVLSANLFRAGSSRMSPQKQKDISLNRKIIKNQSNIGNIFKQTIGDRKLKNCEMSEKFSKLAREKVHRSLEYSVKQKLNDLAQRFNSPQKPLNLAFSKLDSIEFYKESRHIDKDGNFQRKLLTESSELHVPLRKQMIALHNSCYHKQLEKKTIALQNDCLRGLEHLKMNSLKSRLKKNELFLKYGGLKFVQKFVGELFFRLSCLQDFDDVLYQLDLIKMLRVFTLYSRAFKFECKVKEFTSLHADLGFKQVHFGHLLRSFKEVAVDFSIQKIDLGMIIQYFDVLKSKIHTK